MPVGVGKGLLLLAIFLCYDAVAQDRNRQPNVIFSPRDLTPTLEEQPPQPENPLMGQFPANLKKACVDRVMGGAQRSQDLPQWALELCSHRYIFVGGFMHSGTGLVRYLIASHPLVHAHIGTGQVEDEGQYLQSVFPPRQNRERDSWALCGCRTCGYNCPRLQDTIISVQNREKLYEEWFGGRSAMISSAFNLEKSPDFMALMRSRFFPNVSSHAFPIRHPFCNSGSEGGIKVTLSNGMKSLLGPTKQLNYWLRAWHDLITRQMPLLSGELAVVRFESLVGNEDAISRELWRRMGLPSQENSTAETGSAVGKARTAGSETFSASAAAAAGAAANQRVSVVDVAGQQHRRLPFHEAQLGIDSAEASKVNALVWGSDCGPNFYACGKSAECSALWEASKAVTGFFGYALGEKQIHEERVGGAGAVWGKKQLAGLAEMHWGLA